MDFDKIKSSTNVASKSTQFTGDIFSEMVKSKETPKTETVTPSSSGELLTIDSPKHKFEPLHFGRIIDKYGTIKQKVMKVESKLGLSCIPFDTVKLSDSVEEIQDYRIITLKGRKYASSTNRIINDELLERFINRWKDTIESGEDVKESLVGKVTTPIGEIETCYFNIAELEKIIDLFSEVSGKVVFYENDVIFTTGI